MSMEQDIKAIYWDVDGTFFKKTPEIRNEQEMLKYNLYARCIEEKTGKKRKVDNSLKKEYEDMIERYKSSGLIFINEFGKSKIYFANAISNIDYSKMLSRDEKLIQMIKELGHLKHGILSNDSYKTLKNVVSSVGLDINFFNDPRIKTLYHSNYGILCAQNIKARKPELAPFKQILEVTQLKPRQILYVGDREYVDIKPAHELGMKTALVWTNTKETDADYIFKTVYEVKKLFS
jgi:FMN phosphatase YigB (HAD superfamily)